MNILVITDNLAPYRVGWCDELGKSNKVTILYTKDKDSERNDEWLVKESKFCTLYKLKSININGKKISLEVIKFLKNPKYEIIVFDGYGPITNMIGIIYMNMKTKHVFINIDGIVKNTKENLLKVMIKKGIFRKNVTVLCGSKTSKENLMAYGVVSQQIYGHPFTSLSSEDILTQLLTSNEKKNLKNKLKLNNKKTVIAVGRFLKLKQFDMLLYAWKYVNKDYQLILIGEGEEKQNYLEIIESLKLENVEILDFKKKQELFQYYKASDLFILPTRSDVWGLVINEAMACGLPIISTDNCVAAKELIINDVNGFIIKYNDCNKLTEKINEILSDENKIKSMSMNSLDIIKPYTLENMARIHMEIFSRLK